MMPIKMIWVKVSEDSIISIECAQMIRHKTRNFEHDMSFFLSFFLYFEEYISESSPKITSEVDWNIWETSMKKMVEN